MNIFYLDHNIELCAKYHVDRHAIKMVLEYFQILSTTLHLSGLPSPYKPTHVNHPCAKWARESAANFDYLEILFLALCDEYTYRYGKVHACETKWEESVHLIHACSYRLPDAPFTYPPLCMPDQYKTACPVESYRLYYLGDKARMLKWKNRDTPYWARGAA
jgi:hypothetical protein